MPNVPNNQISQFPLPSGIDWADGLSGRLGTASPDSSIIYNTPGGGSTSQSVPFNEITNSPTLERAEQATCTHKYTLSWAEAQLLIGILGRGTLINDSYGNYYRILSSTIQRTKPNTAELTVVSEGVSFDVPPDEFQITPVKLNLDLLKYPRYFYALMPTNQIPQPWPSWLVADNSTQIAAKQTIIRAIQAYRENPVIPTSLTLNNISGALHDGIISSFVSAGVVSAVPNPNFKPQFNATPNIPVGGTLPGAATINGQPNPQYYYVGYDPATDPNGKYALAVAAAQEIIQKLWRLEDSPLINGWEITWSEYYFRPPPLNPGSYVENPTKAVPPLPDYFYSYTYPPDSNYTVFDWIASINPQLYSDTGQFGGKTAISWLRDADTIEYSRTWFKVTRKWLGAPVGAWDVDLYNQNNRPLKPSDYRAIITS
jgi:hypothetical protein